MRKPSYGDGGMAAAVRIASHSGEATFIQEDKKI